MLFIMIPNFEFLGKEYSAYMICVLIGIFVAGPFAVTRLKKPLERNDYLNVLIISGIGVLLGGSLLYGLTNIKTIILLIKDGAGFFEVVQSFAGSVFYGGMIGGVFAGWLYSTLKKYPTEKFLDVTALFIPLFHAFGRVGCFLTGCCYGVECSVGFVYKYSPAPSGNGVTRFPIQLVESFFLVLIFVGMYVLFKKGTFKYRLIYIYFLSYGVLRFITEFFRGDYYRGFFLGVSTSQWISIILIMFAVFKLISKKNYLEADKAADS